MPQYIDGDLLQATKIDYIVHQCNCLTMYARGLASDIAKKWPYADLYAQRTSMDKQHIATPSTRGVPGTCVVMPPPPSRTTGMNQPTIVALLAQWRPGHLQATNTWRYPESEEKETNAQRLNWFRQALFGFVKQFTEPIRLAVPYMIGCGLAGGDWNEYRSVLETVEKSFPYVSILVYRKP